MACPDPQSIQSLVDGSLDAASREHVAAHMESCDVCRETIVSLLGGETPARRPLPAVGDRLGRYVVEKVIGAGAMGVVLAARDPDLDRPVAVKLLHDYLGAGPERQARLVREAQALARVRHPNVVTVYDIGTWQDRVFIAMELVEGATLRGWLAERERPWSEVLAVLIEAGRGLAAAHAAGIVHRDFKPDNVLVANGHAAVTDFGLARREQVTESASDPATAATGTLPVLAVTQSGVLLGTPVYMPPEQIDAEDAGPAADQFAFCVALYEALYGVRPFEGSTLRVLRENIYAGRYAPPKRGHEVPRAIQRAIVRGLAPQPGDRHPSLDALLAALAPRRRRGPVAVAAAVAVAAVLAGWQLLGHHASAPRPEPKLVRITSAEDEFVGGGAISLDGTKIAYVTLDAIVIRDLASHETKRFPNDHLESVAWAPDGTHLITSASGFYTPGADHAMYEIDTTTGARRAIGIGTDPSYSPDGKHLAYVGREAVWIANADATAPRQLLPLEGQQPIGLRWSHDSRHMSLVLADRVRSPQHAKLYALDLDGTRHELVDERRLAMPNLEGGVAWHPDGRIIYMTYDDAASTPEVTLWALRVDRAGNRDGTPQRLTSWSGARSRTFSIARTGTLAFVHSAGTFDVYTGALSLDPPKLQLTRLTTDAADDRAGGLLDDTHVLFASQREGTYDIYVQALDSRSADRLIAGAGDEYGPELSPDGTQILYWQRQADVLRLLRIPRTGGAATLVLRVDAAAIRNTGIPVFGISFHCRPTRCVLLERRSDGGPGENLVVSELDPVHGRGRELAHVRTSYLETAEWALSFDARTIALPERDRVRLISLAGEPEHTLPVGLGRSVAWFPDGRHVLVSGGVPNIDRMQIVYAGVDGGVAVVWEGPRFGLLAPSITSTGTIVGTSAKAENTLWLVTGI